MQKLSIALRKQKREIEKLKCARIGTYVGLGREIILSFNDRGFRYTDGTTDTQKKIDEGKYKSIIDFDSFHTADIEFSHLYNGRKIGKYENRTWQNLIEIGKCWRERVSHEFPLAEVTIVVHKSDGIVSLDTFNYPIVIENAIYV